MIISHPYLVCSHVSDKQVTWEAIYNWNNLGLLATRALHAMFSKMPSLVPVKLRLVLQQVVIIQAPALLIQALPYYIGASCLHVA